MNQETLTKTLALLMEILGNVTLAKAKTWLEVEANSEALAAELEEKEKNEKS